MRGEASAVEWMDVDDVATESSSAVNEAPARAICKSAEEDVACWGASGKFSPLSCDCECSRVSVRAIRLVVGDALAVVLGLAWADPDVESLVDWDAFRLSRRLFLARYAAAKKPCSPSNNERWMRS